MPQTASGLTFYEDQFETGLYQGLTQAVNGFNAASGGAITLANGARKGRKPEATFFQATSGLIQRRDPSGTGNLTPVPVGNTTKGAIKLFDAAPLLFRRQDWVDQGMSNETGTRLYAVMYGEALAERFLNTAISALLGSIQAIGATAIHDESGSGPMTYGRLNKALVKLGDRRQMAKTLLSHSVPLGDMMDQAFTSQQVAFQLGSTTIYNGGMASYGMQVVNTDAPPLFIDNVAPAVDHYWTLALTPGAVSIKTGPSSKIFSFVPGDGSATPENQTWLLSVESEFEIEIKGVSYTHADLNPNDAALADPGHWTHKTGATPNVKHGPGLLIKTQ